MAWFSTLKVSWPWPGSGHTAHRRASLNLYVQAKFHGNGRNLLRTDGHIHVCTDGWTFETGFIKSTWSKSRPKKAVKWMVLTVAVVLKKNGGYIVQVFRCITCIQSVVTDVAVWLCISLCVGHMGYCEKMGEPIKMPFRGWLLLVQGTMY